MNTDTLKQAFVAALDIDPETTQWDTLAYRGIKEWDSVAHMRLVGEVEDAFDVMLDTDEVIGMSSFTVAKDILAGKGVDFD